MAKGTQAGPFVLFVMGLIFAGAGLALVYYFGQDIKLNCARSLNQCVIEKTSAFGDEEIEEFFKLSSLAGAQVIEKKDSEGDYTYEVLLITDQGRVPMSDFSSVDHNLHKMNAEKINNYVRSLEESLEIKQSGKLIRIIGFVFAGIGGLMLLGFLLGLLRFVIRLVRQFN
ncbi:MAG: hypothetical protein A2Y25_11185 [Candidatus Melainabacteria bacterium GWF2_37_15]|nr:MAG: hypothetical protein A2Y25_11185 [Candidatus Melainabacteria bacterium GWF2_37_15]